MPQTRAPIVTFDVAVNGAPLPLPLQARLVHVVVDQRMRVPDLAALTFHDPERDVLDDAALAIGGPITVKARTSDSSAPVTLFDGEITAVEVEYDGAGMHAVVRGLDRSHRLTRGQRSTTYLNMTSSDIAKRVGQGAGLRVQADATRPVHEHVFQLNESDWDFLLGLANEIGFEVWVEGGTLRFAAAAPAARAPTPGDLQASSPLQLVLGENLQSLRAVATSTEQVGSATVRGWDPAQKRAVVASVPRPEPEGAVPGMAAARFTAYPGDAVAVATPYALQGDADAASKGFAQEVASPRAEIEGTALGEPELRAGTTVSIGQAGTQFSGRYTVTATRHVYEPGEGYRTDFSVTGRADRTLRGLVGANGDASASSGGAHGRLGGVVTAVVTNNNDPQDLGRVKVKFPWLDDTQESTWARTVQLVAGVSAGSAFLPEVNDEVLVAFAHGDVSQPYVVGSLYNGKDKPQKTSREMVKGGKVAQRRIETPTLNRLVFFDHRGTKEGVTLRTGDDKYFIELNKTGTKVVVSSNGDVLIEAKTGKVDITAQQNLTLKAGKDLNLEATGKTVIKGAQVEVNAQATMKLQASGPLEAKGAVIKLN